MHDVAVKKHKISLWNYLFVPKCTQQNGDRNKMSSRTHKFPGSSVGKESACSAGDPDLVPGSGRSPGEGNGNPLQYSCLEKSHGQRSLAGYSPWGCKSQAQLSD